MTEPPRRMSRIRSRSPSVHWSGSGMGGRTITAGSIRQERAPGFRPRASGWNHFTTRLQRLQVLKRPGLEAGAQGGEHSEAERVFVGEDVDLESELEALHEGLEGEQRAAESLGTWGAVAPWLRAPACAAVRPEAELAFGIEAHDQESPACARAEDSLVARRAERRALHRAGEPQLDGGALVQLVAEVEPDQRP